ncbi:hypothetical protein [Marinifilum caeruleilacunae]|uniref:TonB C-terminal domain-containing protein n=1 Tax=Marinifilum caeruleilacunae TaxID=2499076 RepID=A0ABX1WU18_9BACT|nr:hypothetical protein [Marinifilum caeruleilacunae]NOU59605.1 hypothetical protein [Marinifilum caeruleilacunae]
MKRLIKILTIILLPLSGYATGQVGDILIYKGDTLKLFANPLEEYFEKKQKRTINEYELKWTSTACYRGYQATWELTNDSLFLVRIQKGCYSKNPEYFNLKEEFGTERVFAHWFTGNTLAPKGKLIQYFHSGYDSLYEKELTFSFTSGILTEQIEYDNSKSYKSVFTENQDSLRNFIYTNINWNLVPNLENKKARVFISIKSGEKLKPDSIVILRGLKNELLNQEALRVVNLIPEWDVYYRHGKVYRMGWTIPIVFSEENRKKYAR